MTDSRDDQNAVQSEFGGECAFAISLGKRGAAGSPDCRLERDGKTYLFKNRVARSLFKLLPNREEKAAAAWAAGG